MRDNFFLSSWWFKPSWNILVKMESSPNSGKHKTYLKPPPSYPFIFGFDFWKIPFEGLKLTLDDDRMREVLMQKLYGWNIVTISPFNRPSVSLHQTQRPRWHLPLKQRALVDLNRSNHWWSPGYVFAMGGSTYTNLRSHSPTGIRKCAILRTLAAGLAPFQLAYSEFVKSFQKVST